MAYPGQQKDGGSEGAKDIWGAAGGDFELYSSRERAGGTATSVPGWSPCSAPSTDASFLGKYSLHTTLARGAVLEPQ